MVMRRMRLVGIGFGLGAAVGVALDRLLLELRKPAAEQFPWLRRAVNQTVNPWLLERRIPGSGRAEIGTLEHVGRASGVAHLTPVHPTLRGDEVLIPAPLGVGSQWARNALATGRARLHLHDTLYELVQPELIAVADTGFYPSRLAAPFDRIGWRYVRFHVAASMPGAITAAPRPTDEGSMPRPAEPMEPVTASA